MQSAKNNPQHADLQISVLLRTHTENSPYRILQELCLEYLLLCVLDMTMWLLRQQGCLRDCGPQLSAAQAAVRGSCLRPLATPAPKGRVWLRLMTRKQPTRPSPPCSSSRAGDCKNACIAEACKGGGGGGCTDQSVLALFFDPFGTPTSWHRFYLVRVVMVAINETWCTTGSIVQLLRSWQSPHRPLVS